MQHKIKKQITWSINLQSVYRSDRDDRIGQAFELIHPKVEIEGEAANKDLDKDANGGSDEIEEISVIRKSIER